jgi:hypothetical protein
LHPSGGAVTPETWRSASVGHVGETVTHDGRLVHATVYVNDADAIRKIQAGERKELSAGYFADTDETPGVHEGQAYDRRQTNINYNHLSLQPPGGGRAGPECALRIDSDDAICVDTCQAVPDDSVMAIRIDGKDHEPATAQAAVDSLAADRDGLKGALAVATAKVADLTKRCDAAEDPKRIVTAVKERVTLLESIRKGHAHYLTDAEDPPEPDAESDPIELMREALAKWQPALKTEGMSPPEITGAFKAMLADVTEDDTPDAPAQDALAAKPAPNTAPEMELNGKRRGDGRAARRALHADAGGMRHDHRGFPEMGDSKRPLNAEEKQRADNAARASQPMHDTTQKGA